MVRYLLLQLMVFKFNLFHLGFIGHVLPENLEVAYMLYSISFLMGYFINFVSGVILDVQGVQYLIIVSLVVSLPLYVLGEWMLGSSKADSIAVEVNHFCFIDCVILLSEISADCCCMFHIKVILH